MSKFNLSIIVFFVFLATVSFAQNSKHPRAVELENQLTKTAHEFLKGRFPDKPFTVVVNVEPTHRYGDQKPMESEKIPYFDMADSEIVDEWDDPTFSHAALMSRVKKALVTVSVPSDVTKDEMAEIEQSIFMLLNLFKTRDEVKIQLRNWGEENKLGNLIWLVWVGVGLVAIILFLSGLFVVLRGTTSKLAKAIAQTQNKTSNLTSTPTMPALSQDGKNSTSSPSMASGNLRFNDPIKIREIVLKEIHHFDTHREFPTLNDIIMLDKWGSETPSELGAFLIEFSQEKQDLIFSYSNEKYWLDALNEPGELSSTALEFIQKLHRVHREIEKFQIQKLLISVWRMSPADRTDYLRSISKDDAMTILNELPKSIAVQSARSAFPGNWAQILDLNVQSRSLNSDQINSLYQKALTQFPLRKTDSLKKYSHIKDLLSYLKSCDPKDEKEIYLTIPADSILHNLRMPFYKILELEKEDLEKIVPLISLDDWSYAMLNIPNDQRKNLENVFSEKQRFLYKEKLKLLDQKNVSKDICGEYREKIADFSIKYLTNQKSAAQETEPINAEENKNLEESPNNEDDQAA
jgi:hypothetical protein